MDELEQIIYRIVCITFNQQEECLHVAMKEASWYKKLQKEKITKSVNE